MALTDRAPKQVRYYAMDRPPSCPCAPGADATRLLHLSQTSCRVTQPSKLLTLPVELVELIFEDVYSSARPPSRPLCRALLRFHDERHRRSRYRRVHLVGSSMLSGYTRSLQIRSSIGAACQSFRVVGGFRKRVVDIAPGLVDLVFSSLPNVRNLELEGDQLVRTFLQRADAQVPPFMPRLAQLSLEARLADRADPYHPSFLRGLSRIRRLTSLSLSLTGGTGAAAPIEPGVDFSLGKLEDLSLTNARSSTGAVDLVARCSSLSQLEISDDAEYLGDPRLLQAAAAHGTLETLSLEGKDGGDEWELPDVVKAMPTLTELRLGRGCNCVDKASFEILAHLPALETLAFGPGSDVSTARLLKLIEGKSKKHPALKNITLDCVYASYKELPDEPWSKEEGHADAVKDWLDALVLPEWTDALQPRGLSPLYLPAYDAGVDVSGTAIDAHDCEDLGEERNRAVLFLENPDEYEFYNSWR